VEAATEPIEPYRRRKEKGLLGLILAMRPLSFLSNSLLLNVPRFCTCRRAVLDRLGSSSEATSLHRPCSAMLFITYKLYLSTTQNPACQTRRIPHPSTLISPVRHLNGPLSPPRALFPTATVRPRTKLKKSKKIPLSLSISFLVAHSWRFGNPQKPLGIPRLLLDRLDQIDGRPDSFTAYKKKEKKKEMDGKDHSCLFVCLLACYYVKSCGIGLQNPDEPLGVFFSLFVHSRITKRYKRDVYVSTEW